MLATWCFSISGGITIKAAKPEEESSLHQALLEHRERWRCLKRCPPARSVYEPCADPRYRSHNQSHRTPTYVTRSLCQKVLLHSRAAKNSNLRNTAKYCWEWVEMKEGLQGLNSDFESARKGGDGRGVLTEYLTWKNMRINKIVIEACSESGNR